MEVPEYFNKALLDIGGRREDGGAKLRVVPPGYKRRHGKLAGQVKYINPLTCKAVDFWVLETWMPAHLAGTREGWPYELLGPYPTDCDQDCCNRGFWGFKLAIANQFGQGIPPTEEA